VENGGKKVGKIKNVKKRETIRSAGPPLDVCGGLSVDVWGGLSLDVWGGHNSFQTSVFIYCPIPCKPCELKQSSKGLSSLTTCARYCRSSDFPMQTLREKGVKKDFLF